MTINNFTDLTGGLPGLVGTSFSPIPGTPIGAAARKQATSLQPVTRVTIPTFRPTAQATLPTQLLSTPETIGQQAFRPIREEIAFPQLSQPFTMEEIEERMNLLEITPQLKGSIMEPPVPSPMVQLPETPLASALKLLRPTMVSIPALPPAFRIEHTDTPQPAFLISPPPGSPQPWESMATDYGSISIGTPVPSFGAYGPFGISHLERP